MNQTTSTALALPEPVQLDVMFKSENGLDPLLAQIEASALAMVKDLNPENKKDRDLMKSAANKVSLSKAEIDRRGKELTEAQRREVNAVNAGRRIAEGFLSALRDRVRKPADDWDAMDRARIERCKGVISAFVNHGMTGEEASSDIRAKAENMKAVAVGDDFQEYQDQAIAARDAALTTLRILYAAAKVREDQAAELDALRAEKEARAEADRIATEIAAQAAEDARVKQAEADRQEAARVQAEEIAARVLAEKAKAVQDALDQARIDAEKKAAQDAADAAKREADIRAEFEASAAKERDRIAQTQAATEAARAKREADTAHRDRIASDIADALRTMAGNAAPELIAVALMEGRIPHVTVNI